MCNYFSIGIESRVGLGFDKKRTKSAACNKVCYGLEGLKKMFCCCCCHKKTMTVRETIDYLAVIDQEGKENILFATDPKLSGSSHFLRGDPVSIVCTNISSMMGGKANMWESGRN
jgi:diacylglycerol kinase (ATP)